MTKKSRRQDSEIRKLEEDYGNILQLSLELMDLLQSSIQGEPVTIGNDIFERLSARLVSRPTTAISVTSQEIGEIHNYCFFLKPSITLVQADNRQLL